MLGLKCGICVWVVDRIGLVLGLKIGLGLLLDRVSVKVRTWDFRILGFGFGS